jgi:hypothetical protein
MVFLYPKGLIIIKKIFHIVPYIMCGDCIHIYLVILWYFLFRYMVLKKWYQSTFIGKNCGQLFFLFLQFFFSEKSKRARHFG